MSRLLVAAVVTALALSGVEGRAATLPSGQVLDLGADARTLGTGQAYLAAPSSGSVASLSQTPLGLAGVGQGAFAFSHAFLINSISLDQFAYGRGVGPLAVGFAVTRLDYGAIDERDAGGTLTGGYHPRDTVLQLSAAGAWRRTDLGVSVKYLDSRILTSAQAFALDAAARYPLNEDVAVAVALRNLGTRLKFENESAPLPSLVGAGLSWAALPGLRANLDANAPLYAPVWVAVGAEYGLAASSGTQVVLRLGANTKTPELGGLAGLNAGVGFSWKPLQVDYSYDPFGDLGDTQRISVEYKW